MLSFIFFVETGHFAAIADASDYTQRRVLVDAVGREVAIPKRVDRIACLYAFTGHAVTMLGRGDDVVAVSNGLKRDSLFLAICPAIGDALVPKSQGAINVEELLKASPDILFLPGDVAGNTGDVEKLDRFSIPYLVVDYTSVETQQAAIEMIGRAIGAETRAEKFVRYFKACIQRVKDVVESIPSEARPRLYHAVNEPLRTTLKNGLAADWLKVTGCRNVALLQEDHLLDGKNIVSLEQILYWDPEVIIANEPSAVQLILEDSKWATLKAVKDKKVFQMPMGISRWGHPGSLETPLAILWTAKMLYPEHFGHVDMEKETQGFYLDFFNYELDIKTVKKILGGKLVRKPKQRTDDAHLLRRK